VTQNIIGMHKVDYLRGKTAADIFIFIVHFGSCPL
jgi:hypothetical protein